MSPTTRIGVLASGRGSNLQSIIDGIESGEVHGDLVVVGSNNPDAQALERARRHDIPWFCVDHRAYESRGEHDRAMMRRLDEYDLDLLVLAGYMRVIESQEFLEEYYGRMINIHPSLLPAFPGPHAQRDAYEYGVKWSGCTVHFVTPRVDEGPIIAQRPVYIGDCRSAEEVEQRILEEEHEVLPLVVDSFSHGQYEINGRNVEYVLDSKC